MKVIHSGDRAISLSGYNSTIRDISVKGNGCGGISLSGGDQVMPIETQCSYIYTYMIVQELPW